MKNILFILLVLFSLTSCENEDQNNDSIYGFWKQEDTGRYMLEFKPDSKIIFYENTINVRYKILSTTTFEILSNTAIVIDNKNLFYKIENGKLSIYDENKDIHYQYPFIKSKEPELSEIPDCPVNYTLNFYQYPDDIRLREGGVGAFMCITQKRFEKDQLGFGGLLVVHGGNGVYAYDLACPNEASRDVLVVPDKYPGSSQTIAKCPKCGAIYSIIYGRRNDNEYIGYGAPMSGSICRLRAYRVVGFEDRIECVVMN